MLEKTKVAIKNGQSRDTGNVRETRRCNLQFPVTSALDTNDKEQSLSNTSATLQSPSSDKEEKSFHWVLLANEVIPTMIVIIIDYCGLITQLLNTGNSNMISFIGYINNTVINFLIYFY
jgi:hypothetical protein